MPEKRIGILGGSFNPPHLAHVAMARQVLAEGKVDEVWVIPCFIHPFDKPLLSFEHRLQMCERAFSDLGGPVRCLDIEKKLGGKSYTVRTIAYLKQKNPLHTFHLIVGGDVAKEAKGWHDYEKLKGEVDWLIIPRGKTSPIPDISATETREVLLQRKNLRKYLSKNVIEYIEQHQLYKN